MTHYDRIHLAMRHQKPDRVPVMCQLSQGYMAINGGEKPFDMYFSAESAARAFFRTREDLQFDGILLNVAFEDDWKDLYDRVKVESTPRGGTLHTPRRPDLRGLQPSAHVGVQPGTEESHAGYRRYRAG